VPLRLPESAVRTIREQAGKIKEHFKSAVKKMVTKTTQIRVPGYEVTVKDAGSVNEAQIQKYHSFVYPDHSG
jgi:hypothetical protein